MGEKEREEDRRPAFDKLRSKHSYRELRRMDRKNQASALKDAGIPVRDARKDDLF